MVTAMRTMIRRVPSSRAPWTALAALAACLGLPVAAAGQIGALVSPGPLSRPHSQLEGIANCQKCHEPGRQVTAARCLACHKPVADRIAARKGVHRDVAGQCVGCHAEHAGLDAELRPFDTARFDHARETGFALDGRHAPLARDCARCHRTRSFLTARPDCASCHKDPHQGGLGARCQSCHPTSSAFAEARKTFDHSRAKFPLVGAHRGVDCAQCHTGKLFTGLRFASCTDCHKTPHRAALGPECTSCHSQDTWKTTRMDHSRTAFPLKGRHTGVACGSCHVKPAARVRLEADRCSRCHADVHRGQFKQDCAACHQETGFAQAPFDHARETRFPLTGRHLNLPCARCHKGASTVSPGTAPRAQRTVLFGGASSACVSCHEDVHRGETSRSCETCHTTANFAVSTYTHPAASAGFFRGQHASASCASCHGRPLGAPIDAARIATAGPQPAARAPIATWRFKAVGTACAGCHADVHKGQFTAACETCHTVEDRGFTASRFSHAATAFALTGRHQAVPCSACHKVTLSTSTAARFARLEGTQGSPVVFRGTPSDCASCHEDTHLAQLGPRCEACHSTETFKLSAYTHRAAGLDRFFVGVHATLACRACHKPESRDFPGGRGTAVRYTGLGTACATCHAAEDVHRGALGGACETCHEPERWPTVSRAFHKAGTFPLEGRHLSVPCASCHVDGVTKGTPTRCFDCHWVRRQDDPYQTRLGSQCEQCHRPTTWTAVSWNHAARTGYPLNLAHQLLRCDNCHKQGQFTNTRMDCFGCHQATYQAARTPNHVEAGFPTGCESCHKATDPTWRGASFNHAATFPLVGVHATQACRACHTGNVYRGTPRTCIGCHRDDYQRTQNPNHAAAGFPTTCETCHRATEPSFRGATFNHAAAYALVGVHATQACAACHRNNVYAGTPRDCVGCHQDDYQRTQNPNHAAAGFPTACESCHQASSSTWTASFNHNQFFPLLGRHQTQACASCHKGGVYKGTPRDCYPCHQAAYDQTRSPNHRAAGFGTGCESCHRASDSTWQAGSFNHRFPITSGPHANRPCSACHVDSNTYKVFSCTTCHGRSETDREHTGENGYRYDSLACYACHPNGRH